MGNSFIYNELNSIFTKRVFNRSARNFRSYFEPNVKGGVNIHACPLRLTRGWNGLHYTEKKLQMT